MDRDEMVRCVERVYRGLWTGDPSPSDPCFAPDFRDEEVAASSFSEFIGRVLAVRAEAAGTDVRIDQVVVEGPLVAVSAVRTVCVGADEDRYRDLAIWRFDTQGRLVTRTGATEGMEKRRKR